MTRNQIPAHLQLFVLDMAALNGKTVCQGHADVCELIGHGKNLRNGVEQGSCPRCGFVTVPANFTTEPINAE